MLTIHLNYYSTEAQGIQASEALLRILEVKGYKIISATHNDIPIQPAEAS